MVRKLTRDSQATLHIASDPMFSGKKKNKAYRDRLLFIKQKIESGCIND